MQMSRSWGDRQPLNYNNRDRGRKGRLYLLPSLSRDPDSIPKLLPSTLLRHRRLLPGPWRRQMRSSVDVESLEAFNVSNAPPTDRSLIVLLSNPLVPPLEVDHHRSSCCLSSFNQSMRAMLTIVFVFMLFNLTSIWNLPTISTGCRANKARDAITPTLTC